jgi:hypothetical protein
VSNSRQVPPAPADFSDVRPGDGLLRWWVRSRETPKDGREPDEYLVDLGAYGGHGKCTCRDFETRFEKHLARLRTPAECHEAGWVKVRAYQTGVSDVLCCWHLIRLRSYFAQAMATRISDAQKKQSPQPAIPARS